MKVIETKIPGVLIVETDVFGDHRGYFTETYSPNVGLPFLISTATSITFPLVQDTNLDCA